MDKSLGARKMGMCREALGQRERLKRLKRQGLPHGQFDWLEMAEYPDNLALAQAKNPGLLGFALCVLGTLILLGFWGYLPIRLPVGL